MTGMVSSMSHVTDTKVKYRVHTITTWKTVAGCGDANRLSKEQSPVANGVVT